jgi:hypothetical protein
MGIEDIDLGIKMMKKFLITLSLFTSLPILHNAHGSDAIEICFKVNGMTIAGGSRLPIQTLTHENLKATAKKICQEALDLHDPNDPILSLLKIWRRGLPLEKMSPQDLRCPSEGGFSLLLGHEDPDIFTELTQRIVVISRQKKRQKPGEHDLDAQIKELENKMETLKQEEKEDEATLMMQSAELATLKQHKKDEDDLEPLKSIYGSLLALKQQ